jgi:hypothetical protein
MKKLFFSLVLWGAAVLAIAQAPADPAPAAPVDEPAAPVTAPAPAVQAPVTAAPVTVTAAPATQAQASAPAQAPAVLDLDRAVDALARKIEAPLPEGAICALLGLDAANRELADYTLNRLTKALIAGQRLVMVERDRLDLIEKEMNFQLSLEVSQETELSIGRKLGAAYIITGSGRDMGDFYTLSFKTLEVESARIISQEPQDIRKDGQYLRLVEGEEAGRAMGLRERKFTLGARAGPGIEFNSPEIGAAEGLLKAEAKSNVNFNAGLYGAYNFSPLFAFQAELALAFNSGILIEAIDNGMWLNGEGNYTQNQSRIHERFSFSSLDIPLLLRLNFRPAPRYIISLLGGVHISLGLGKLSNSSEYPYFTSHNNSRNEGIKGALFGLSAGAKGGYSLGPGYIMADLRFMNDFTALAANYRDQGNTKILTRRSFNISLGYELWL